MRGLINPRLDVRGALDAADEGWCHPSRSAAASTATCWAMMLGDDPMAAVEPLGWPPHPHVGPHTLATGQHPRLPDDVVQIVANWLAT